MPHLHCTTIAEAQQAQHVQQVNSLLQSKGLLKITLHFEDDSSSYLKSLLLALHKSHNHGLPITHSASRGWFWDIRPQQRPSSPTSNLPTARSETMDCFPWHTDCSYEASPPRYFALQVLREDRRGGGVLSLLSTPALLAGLSRSTLEALCKREFRIAVPPEFLKQEHEREITGCVLRWRGADEDKDEGQDEGEGEVGRFRWAQGQLRFREDITSATTVTGSAALDELNGALAAARARGLVLDLGPEVVPRGSIVLVDNRRWLHARNRVRDPERHLRRARWDARPFDTL